MTANKRWLSKICSEDSQKSGKNSTKISWCQSDSEPEVEDVDATPEKAKTYDSTGTKRWIKLFNKEVTPPKIEIESEDSTTPVKDYTSAAAESPILNGVKEEELSPIITHRPGTFVKEQSPVIGRLRIVKQLQWRYKFREDEMLIQNVDTTSSDLFPTQSTFHIAEVESATTADSPVKISLVKSQETQFPKIQPISSQEASQVERSSSNNSGSSSSLSDAKDCCNQPPPKKKKLKKGGLGSLLDKALIQQSNSLGIWQHEMYLNKDYDILRHTQSESEVCIDFIVQKEWTEYSSTVLECKLLNSVIDCNTFLLNIDYGLVTYISLSLNVPYRMLPPYKCRVIKYKTEDTRLYYNVSRFLLLSEDQTTST